MPFPLAHGEQMQAVVRAERPAFRVHDFAGLVRQVVAQEIAHFYLADETDTLAVFLACRGETARAIWSGRIRDRK